MRLKNRVIAGAISSMMVFSMAGVLVRAEESEAGVANYDAAFEEQEPNDTKEYANQLVKLPDKDFDGRWNVGSVSAEDSVDWYKIAVNPNEKIHLEILHHWGYWDSDGMKITIYDELGTEANVLRLDKIYDEALFDEYADDECTRPAGSKMLSRLRLYRNGELVDTKYNPYYSNSIEPAVEYLSSEWWYEVTNGEGEPCNWTMKVEIDSDVELYGQLKLNSHYAFRVYTEPTQIIGDEGILDCEGKTNYNLKTDGGTWDGTKYVKDGKMIVNTFFCDGEYTYFLQADGTPMKDRLTYHPDGVHVIYFDENGHEVFSDFHHVKKAIAGNAVDDYCFFDVYGYMYVDVMTYDKTGKKLYYINPYGQIERKGWFKFSSTAVWAGTTKKVGTGWGYGQADGSLMINKWTTNKAGKKVYMQGDGHMK